MYCQWCKPDDDDDDCIGSTLDHACCQTFMIFSWKFYITPYLSEFYKAVILRPCILSRVKMQVEKVHR